VSDQAIGSHGPGGDEVAELVWRVGEDVDPPVTIVVDGKEYEAGAGPPQGRLEMTVEELRAAVARAESGQDRDLTD
jgi:hypothetical protein